MVVLRPTLPPPSQPLSTTATRFSPCSLARVVGGRQAVPATADNHHVILWFWLRRTPGALPAGIALPGLAQQRKKGIVIRHVIRPV